MTAPTFRFWRAVVEGGDLWAPLVKSLTVARRRPRRHLAVAAPGGVRHRELPAPARGTGSWWGCWSRGCSRSSRSACRSRRDSLQLGLTDTYGGSRSPTSRGCCRSSRGSSWEPSRGCRADVEAAAAIDGASRLATLRRVVLPMTAPGLAVAALFAWLYSWNEFLYARLLTTSQNTLPLQVFQSIDRGTRQQMAAVAIVLVLPILGSSPCSSATCGRGRWRAPSGGEAPAMTGVPRDRRVDRGWSAFLLGGWRAPADARATPSARRSRSARPWPRTRGRPSARCSIGSGRRAASR